VRSSGVFERKCKKPQKNFGSSVARIKNIFLTFASEGSPSVNDFPKFFDKTGRFNDKPCEGQRTAKPVFL